jgi:hypothetical protein
VTKGGKVGFFAARGVAIAMDSGGSTVHVKTSPAARRKSLVPWKKTTGENHNGKKPMVKNPAVDNESQVDRKWSGKTLHGGAAVGRKSLDRKSSKAAADANQRYAAASGQDNNSGAAVGRNHVIAAVDRNHVEAPDDRNHFEVEKNQPAAGEISLVGAACDPANNLDDVEAVGGRRKAYENGRGGAGVGLVRGVVRGAVAPAGLQILANIGEGLG